MNPAETPSHGPAPVSGSVDFASRAPSTSWEPLVSADGRNAGWAWFKPAHAPQGLILRVADDAHAGDAKGGPPTMRSLLEAAGIEPGAVGVWYLYGVPYDAAGGSSPYLESPIPPPVPGTDPNILVYVHPAGAPRPMAPAPGFVESPPFAAAAPVYGAAPVAGAPPAQDLTTSELFDRIEADWHASLEIERELSRLRKMLVDMFNRLKNLNRDLNPTERQHANNQDKQDWLDARRWLRDNSNRVWRCIKEHDIGDTSTAGQRRWFEQAYRDYVVPRIPFDGLLQAQRDFETYRKMLQTLQNNMNSAYTMAATDGERRANQVLNRIAAKIRDAQTKRSFFGLIVDS